ncbi:hypothetical protein EV356DRAFT_528062 [Viridothelium virens]|uniref:Ribosome assembly protein 3 n=1 Tax=Viridothelium virens TaxID=1048519 RepID=A0A6A6HMU8_VIRVR|nr:hypothetical protein EV356DRAFT_528062 [Viridothelium virens]
MGSQSKSKSQKSEKRPRKRKIRSTVEFSPTEGSEPEKPDAREDDTIYKPMKKSLPGDDENLKQNSDAEHVEENASVQEFPGTEHGDIEENNPPSEESLAKRGKYLSDIEAEEAFKGFYLRKVTEELAEDLDKARSASDFSERSLPILIEALKQGVGTFTKEERIRIGRANASIHA